MDVLVLQSDPRLSGISGLQVKAGLGKVFLGSFSCVVREHSLAWESDG